MTCGSAIGTRSKHLNPVDYSAPFEIADPVGNNALSYDRRGARPALWVPSLVSGTVHDISPGDRTVFEEFDEHGVLRSCAGLSHLVKCEWHGVPTVVVDNHNHAFYFWCEAGAQEILHRDAVLIHVDQHRDTRIPERLYDGASLEDAFAYTNFHLNVGNYIVPAQHANIIGPTQFATGEDALRDLSLAGVRNKILNIDLDFFAAEMSYIDFALAARFIAAHLQTAALVTIATSPFFIGQDDALRVFTRLREAVAASG